jgi:hypothetical protein
MPVAPFSAKRRRFEERQRARFSSIERPWIWQAAQPEGCAIFFRQLVQFFKPISVDGVIGSLRLARTSSSGPRRAGRTTSSSGERSLISRNLPSQQWTPNSHRNSPPGSALQIRLDNLAACSPMSLSCHSIAASRVRRRRFRDRLRQGAERFRYVSPTAWIETRARSEPRSHECELCTLGPGGSPVRHEALIMDFPCP